MDGNGLFRSTRISAEDLQAVEDLERMVGRDFEFEFALEGHVVSASRRPEEAKLDFSKKGLVVFDSKSRRVRQLFIRDHGLKDQDLPESVRNLSHLRYLSLKGNDFVELPDVFGDMTELESVDLAGNHFSQGLPSSLQERLHSHQMHIRLDDHQNISRKALIAPIQLQAIVALEQATGKDIPMQFGDTSESKLAMKIEKGHVTKLIVDGQKLKSIDKSLFDLEALEHLDLANNLLQIVPNQTLVSFHTRSSWKSAAERASAVPTSE